MSEFFAHNPELGQSLKAFFEPKTLTELGVLGHTLTISVSYEATEFEKTGISALARKVPVIKNLTPFKSPMQAMDIDLSCVILDKSYRILDKIWYANARGLDESVRHVGGLCGATNFEESLAPQESISVQLKLLPKTAEKLLFVISSYHQHALSLATKGVTKIIDNENNLIYAYDLNTVATGEKGVVAWVIERYGDDFRVSAPQKGLGEQFNPTKLDSELTKLVGAI